MLPRLVEWVGRSGGLGALLCPRPPGPSQEVVGLESAWQTPAVYVSPLCLGWLAELKKEKHPHLRGFLLALSRGCEELSFLRISLPLLKREDLRIPSGTIRRFLDPPTAATMAAWKHSTVTGFSHPNFFIIFFSYMFFLLISNRVRK